MRRTSIFLVGAIIIFCPVSSFSANPVITAPIAVSVLEDTEHKFMDMEEIKVEDEDKDLKSVELSVKKGKLDVPEIDGLVRDPKEEDVKITLSGTQDIINAALKELSYKANRNYRGPDILTIVSQDEAGGKESSAVGLTIIIEDVFGPCTSYTKAVNEGKHIGDWFKNLSVGSVVNYSVVRYNLADKKSSFNARAFGFGVAFRYYSDDQLGQANKDDISGVPLACRARTTDLLNFNVAPVGELPKIGAALSISPTFYVFKDKNENDLGTQIALNFGFLNDFLSIGVGWNISGGDAGEWFVLAGPSVGFQF